MNIELDSGYASRTIGKMVISAILSIGVAYIVIQWLRHGEIQDGIFVSLLIAATMILVKGIRSIFSYSVRKGPELFTSMEATDPVLEYRLFIDSVYNSKRMTISGVAYGLLIGVSPTILRVWPDDIFLLVLLCLFLFTINFVTGVAFYSLINFFIFSIQLGKKIAVDLWQRENPATMFLFNIGKRISILASIYITTCISSITFSILPLSAFTIGYSVFAGCIVISSLIIPLIPVIKKLQEQKHTALSKINNKLQIEFQKVITNHTSGDTNEYRKIESLILLHDKIEAIHVFPFRVKLIQSIISILFVSSIPALLELILEHVINK